MRPEQFLSYSLNMQRQPLPWEQLQPDNSCANGHCGAIALRPFPAPDGSLHQDPDFTLPSVAGPITWALHWNSLQASRPSNWGYGRRCSLDLTLETETQGSTVLAKVQHETGNLAFYRSTGGPFFADPGTVGLLVQNWDGSWDETRGDTGAVYHFSSGTPAVLEYRESPWGKRVTFSYSGSQLVSVEEPEGKRMTIGYGTNGLAEYVEDWGGRRNTLTYDGLGSLIEVEGPTGCITQYDYDSQLRLNSIVDPEGYETTYTYDELSRVTSRSVAGNQTRYSYSYDTQGNLRNTVIDPLGRMATLTVDQYGQIVKSLDPLGNEASFTYEGFRQTAGKNPLGYIWTYGYDSRGNQTSSEDPLGNRTTRTYDAYNNLLTEQNALGYVTTYSYGANPQRRQVVTMQNALGYVTTYGYNAFGAQEFAEDPLGYRVTQVWREDGLLEAIVSQLGYQRSYGYDLVGNRIVEVDPLGNRWSFYHDPMGRVSATENPLGSRRTTVYDARGLTQSVIDPLGRRFTYFWNAYGSVKAIVNPLGYRLTSQFDSAGALVGGVDPLGGHTTFVYDNAGHFESAQSPIGACFTVIRDAAGRPVVEINALGLRTTLKYDAANHLVSRTVATGACSSYAYNSVGQRVSTIDALNRTHTSVYSPVSQLIADMSPAGQTMTYEYDPRGYRYCQEGYLGELTTYVVDASGRETALIDPLGARWTTSYLATNVRASIQTPLGYLTTFEYNSANDLTVTTRPTGEKYTYGYDSAGNILLMFTGCGSIVTYVYDELDQLVGEVSGSERTTFVFDALARPTISILPEGEVVTRLFDAASRVVAVAAAGSALTYTYDQIDRLATITSPEWGCMTFIHDTPRRILEWMSSAGVRASASYDLIGNVTHRIYQVDEAPEIAEFQVAYDNLGRPSAVLDLGCDLTTYTYYSSGRLRSEHHSGIVVDLVTYAYDLVGNRIARSSLLSNTIYAYDLDRRMLSMVETRSGLVLTLGWSANGALETECRGSDRKTFSWGSFDRLTQVVQSDGTEASYTYNSAGLRRSANISGQSMSFLWDEGRLVSEQPTASDRTSYLVTPKGWGDVLAGGNSTDHPWLVVSPLSHVSRRLSAQGGCISTQIYSAYGDVLFSADDESHSVGFGGSIGYYTDASDSIYVRQRYYRPDLGIWISMDPMSPIDSPYSYVDGRPTERTDPSGLYAISTHPGSSCDSISNDLTAGLKALCRSWHLLHPVVFVSTVQQCAASISGCSNSFGLKQLKDLKNMCNNSSYPYIQCLPLRCGVCTRKLDDGRFEEACGVTLAAGSNCVVTMCLPLEPICHNGYDPSIPRVTTTLIHEMLHCAGIKHLTPAMGNAGFTCNNLLTCCILNAATNTPCIPPNPFP